MDVEELKFPEWQSPLQEAILEFDREKLPEKIRRVEEAISQRLQHLRAGAGDERHRDERESLNDALSILRLIKRDKLGFPDWQ